MSSELIIYTASIGGLKGIAGTSGPASREIGASRNSKAFSEIIAEISAPTPKTLLSS